MWLKAVATFRCFFFVWKQPYPYNFNKVNHTKVPHILYYTLLFRYVKTNLVDFRCLFIWHCLLLATSHTYKMRRQPQHLSTLKISFGLCAFSMRVYWNICMNVKFALLFCRCIVLENSTTYRLSCRQHWLCVHFNSFRISELFSEHK